MAQRPGCRRRGGCGGGLPAADAGGARVATARGVSGLDAGGEAAAVGAVARRPATTAAGEGGAHARAGNRVRPRAVQDIRRDPGERRGQLPTRRHHRPHRSGAVGPPSRRPACLYRLRAAPHIGAQHRTRPAGGDALSGADVRAGVGVRPPAHRLQL
eukprot:ctg_754.g451